MDHFRDIAIAIGAITGSISIVSLVYMLGVKFTRLETAWDGQMAELRTKVTTMWDVLIIGQLEKGVDKGIVRHESPYRINGDFFDHIRASKHPRCFMAEYMVTKMMEIGIPEDTGDIVVQIGRIVGLEWIAHRARELDFAPEEYLAYMVTAMKQIRRGELVGDPHQNDDYITAIGKAQLCDACEFRKRLKL